MASGSLKVNKPKRTSNVIKVTWSCSYSGVKKYSFIFYYRKGSTSKSKVSSLKGWSKLASGESTKKSASIDISGLNAVDDIKIVVTAKDKKGKKIGSSKTSPILSVDYASKPATPNAPTIVSATTDKITVDFEKASNSTGIQYQLLSDAKKLSNGTYYYDEVASTIIETSDYIPWSDLKNAPHSFYPGRGKQRFVRCRLVKRVWYRNNAAKGKSGYNEKYYKDTYSGWGSISSEIWIRPDTPDKPTKVTSRYKDGIVFLYWDTVTGAEKGYDIQATNLINSEGKPLWVSEQGIISTKEANVGSWIFNMELTDPPYYFRIRAKNSATANEGKSAWSDYITLNTGKRPDPPIIWTLRNSVVHGETITLYFNHNSIDGSEMTDAILHVEGNIEVDYQYSTRKSDPEKAGVIDDGTGIPTYYFKISTENYSEREFTYKLKTQGGYLDPNTQEGYGEYSEQKSFIVYTEPTLTFSELPDMLTSMPVSIKVNAEPNAQKAVSYAVSIVALEPYSYTNNVGEQESVQAGDEIFHESYTADGNEQVITLTSEMVHLENIKYNVNVKVYMDSGLDAECDKDIFVNLEESRVICDADVEINEEYLYATIVPKAYNMPYEIAPDYILCNPNPSEFEYLRNPNKYYYYSIENGYTRCEVYDRYDILRQYYVLGFTEEKFNSDKTSYYYYDNELDIFVQCKDETIFSEDETYYKPIMFFDEMLYRFILNTTMYYIYDGFVNCLSDMYTSQYEKQYDSRFQYYRIKYSLPSVQPVLDTWNNGFGWYAIEDDRYLEQGGTAFDEDKTYYEKTYTNTDQPTDTWNDGIGWYVKNDYIHPTSKIQPTSETWNDGYDWYLYDVESGMYIEQIGTEYDSTQVYFRIVPRSSYILQSTYTYQPTASYYRPTTETQPTPQTWGNGDNWYVYEPNSESYISQFEEEYDSSVLYYSFALGTQPQFTWNYGINWYLYNEESSEWERQNSLEMDRDKASAGLYYYSDPESDYATDIPVLDTWRNGYGWYVLKNGEYINQYGEPFDEGNEYYIEDGYVSATPTESNWNNGIGWYLFVQGSVFDSEEVYYEVDENGEYVVSYPTETEFNNDKSKYYYIGLRQCVEEDVYDAQTIYYIPDSYSEVIISIDDYEYDTNKYYVYDLETSEYVKCDITTPYNPDETYYVMSSLKDAKETFFNENKISYYTYSYEQDEYIQCLNTDTYQSTLTYYKPPETYDSENNLSVNASLSVYRRNYDGSFTLIASGIQNGIETVIDPHPALDYARYRVVSTDIVSGKIDYSDIEDVEVGNKSIVLQWSDKWINSSVLNNVDYDVVQYDLNDVELTSMLELPYNISISEESDVDVSLQQYIGRESPVSYYGTQLGISGSWSTAIDKTDSETIFQLRRLQRWRGNVYVREPSGIGYWANIKVSMSNTFDSLITPISIDVTKVEGDTL